MMSVQRQTTREAVEAKYGQIALEVLEGSDKKGCCDSSCCRTPADQSPITQDLYTSEQIAEIPLSALTASLGCGNPTALATLKEGETVLDLGSGGGIDVLLSAKRVGKSGFVFGLDMTDSMLALAEKNRQEAGAENVRFLKGHIEAIPLPENSVDVILSNCVINLSTEKERVLQEAFRVLKPGGRFAVSDVVVEGEIPEALRESMESWVGCIAGALERQQYLQMLTAVGFERPEVQPTRYYSTPDLEDTSCCDTNVKTMSPEAKQDLEGRFMGAFIRATKPLEARN